MVLSVGTGSNIWGKNLGRLLMDNLKFLHHTSFTNVKALSIPNSVWFTNISLKYHPTLLSIAQFCLVNVSTYSMDLKLKVVRPWAYLWVDSQVIRPWSYSHSQGSLTCGETRYDGLDGL